jgi:hypothetical protein
MMHPSSSFKCSQNELKIEEDIYMRLGTRERFKANLFKRIEKQTITHPLLVFSALLLYF